MIAWKKVFKQKNHKHNCLLDVHRRSLLLRQQQQQQKQTLFVKMDSIFAQKHELYFNRSYHRSWNHSCFHLLSYFYCKRQLQLSSEFLSLEYFDTYSVFVVFRVLLWLCATYKISRDLKVSAIVQPQNCSHIFIFEVMIIKCSFVNISIMDNSIYLAFSFVITLENWFWF